MVILALRCPKCESQIQLNQTGPAVMDMADLARQNRVTGGTGVIKCEGCGYEGDPLDFDPRSALPKIALCYITDNGMVICFDNDAHKVPECQGFILEVASDLKFRCDENTQWFLGQCKEINADLGWWWRNG